MKQKHTVKLIVTAMSAAVAVAGAVVGSSVLTEKSIHKEIQNQVENNAVLEVTVHDSASVASILEQYNALQSEYSELEDPYSQGECLQQLKENPPCIFDKTAL